MQHTSKLIPVTACSLLAFYLTILAGFMALGMLHTVDHAMVESELSPQEAVRSEVSGFQEAGCGSSAKLTSSATEGCPGCSKQQKSSIVLVQYYQVFNFCCDVTISISSEKAGSKHFLTYLSENDQSSPEPLLPPPKPSVL